VGAFVALTVLVIVSAYLTAPPVLQSGSQQQVAPPRENVTVVTAHGFETTDSRNVLAAIDTDGTILYYDEAYDNYFDVDPSPAGKYTVLYVAQNDIGAGDCGGDTGCTVNFVERVNLTTGEKTRLFSRVRPRTAEPYFHDVDRIAVDRFLVGDISQDRVFVLNTTTGVEPWAWSVQAAFDTQSGGSYPEDWTHLNDVDQIDDGRVMLSLRNHDQVVFIDGEEGLQDSWTLGSDDSHDVLFEQHNPDYIPADRGGPAILVADSENDRVVEYERHDGAWKRTWTWRDSQQSWPRDVDRLPNGHTLITDTHGNRVIEVGRNGEVTWSLSISSPYDAERLRTGAGSAGGHTATALDLSSRRVASSERADPSAVARFRLWVTALLPSKLVSAISFIAPPWLGFFEVGLLFVTIVLGAVQLGLELYWTGWVQDRFGAVIELVSERVSEDE
jgi:hypothetical protein